MTRKKDAIGAIIAGVSILLVFIAPLLTGKWQVVTIGLGGALGLYIAIRVFLNKEDEDNSDLDADGNEPDGR
ncbi:MAG: hypothetical protein ABIA47_01975 [bacterium]